MASCWTDRPEGCGAETWRRAPDFQHTPCRASVSTVTAARSSPSPLTPRPGSEAGKALRRAGLEVHDDRHLRLVPQADDAAVLVVEDLVGLRKVVLAKQAPPRALSVLAAGLIRAQLLSAHLSQPEPARRARGLHV